MLRHILVPLDGSALAEEALPWAQQVVRPEGKVTLVTALHLPDVLSPTMSNAAPRSRMELDIASFKDYSRWEERVTEDAYRYLGRIADSFKKSKAVTIEVVIASGDPATLIIETAQQHRVDSIVMSTHGRSGLQRWLFGSVAVKVLESRVCPVFLIPGKATERASEPARVAILGT